MKTPMRKTLKVCFNKNNKKNNLRTSKLNEDLSQI